MSETFQNNAERIDYLVGVIRQLAQSMAEAHTVYSDAAAEPAARAQALRQIVGDAGGMRTVGYNLARLGGDELQLLMSRLP